MSKFARVLSLSFFAFLTIFLKVLPASAKEDSRTFEVEYYPETSDQYLNASTAMQSMYDLQNKIRGINNVYNQRVYSA